MTEKLNLRFLPFPSN